MGDEWRKNPATQKQKDKLVFFGCTFDEGITKGQASDAITKCVEMFPEKEKAYQERPATKAQMRKINADLKANGETVEDYAENGKLLTYAEAKEYIEGMELGMETEELKYNVSEYDLETHPYLTWEQTQKAAKSLDKEKPGWRNEQNHFNLMLEKAFQQNPQMTVRQTGRTPRVSKGGKRQRKVSSNPLSTIIFLAVVIWVVWKMASK